jgi:hypothetical protein
LYIRARNAVNQITLPQLEFVPESVKFPNTPY